MASLEQNISDIYERIERAAKKAGRKPEEITLVAATKVQTSETIQRAIAAGIRVCGENRVQEMTAHLEDRAYEGAELHFIGRLQTNKVKYVVGKASLIQSVDSIHLLEAIDRQAEKLGIVQNILLEVNIGEEESKGGFAPGELPEVWKQLSKYHNICACGLMAIPPVASFPAENRPFFDKMKALYVDMGNEMRDNKNSIKYLSMGMSGDFEEAIAAGATMVRVGTSIFGARPKNPGLK